MADDGTPGHGTGAHASLTTVTGPSTIDEIHALFAGLSPGAVESTALAQFELAVVEIAANIVEHAGRGEPVTLDLELTLLPRPPKRSSTTTDAPRTWIWNRCRFRTNWPSTDEDWPSRSNASTS